ncbi:MAG TPA: 2-C-methyl-D-erythritol 2,4-cyclodiphosphate synthase [Candidatus Dormibacteraeota bacterium]|nr:2-C-methyl-D-erythritol 2,4-cyclodiphosphate synthase [Candidatus Dormibacteraeota bacterium]
MARRETTSCRVGYGYDAHPLVPGRPLILGGVRVEHEAGLLGHSDADVLAHAVADAILGAAALGDLGGRFPASDPRWKGADSLRMLAECAGAVREVGWELANVDAVLVAQRPRLGAHVEAMRENLARALFVPVLAVSVKVKSPEGLGFEGEEKGMSASAVALLER